MSEKEPARLDTNWLQDIGNARVAGMSKDLHLSSLQFEWLLRVFYIMYIAFEWMTLLWKIVPAHIYRKCRPEIYSSQPGKDEKHAC